MALFSPQRLAVLIDVATPWILQEGDPNTILFMAVVVAAVEAKDFIDDVIKISPTYPIYAILMSAYYKLNAAASKSEISE